MVRRLYNLQDIYDFLKDYYNLEWRDFRILEQGCARPFKMTDFKKSQVSVPALLQSDPCTEYKQYRAFSGCGDCDSCR